ncbi:MAG: efflux RND transporter periplasmic adaptor subunit [Planctomycetota bacterium]
MKGPIDKKKLALAAVPIFLALVFALIGPAWVERSKTLRKDAAPTSTGGGLTVSFGSSGPGVDVQQPTHGRVAEVVHAAATIKSGGEVAVCAPFDGRVSELCVDEGDAVIASQVVFRLDPIEYDDKLQEAELELARRKAAKLESEAEIKEAEHKWEELQKEPSTLTEARLKIGQSELARQRAGAELENAEARLARSKRMLEDRVCLQQDVDGAEAEKKIRTIGLKSAEGDLDMAKKTLGYQERQWITDKAGAEKALDTARTHVNRARADVTAGEVALYRARRDRERCDVRTPMAGIVTRRNVNNGELTGRPVAAEAPQYIVSDMAHILAYADVDEGDVVKVGPEQYAKVRVNALGDDVKLTGRVIDVANRAYQKPNEDTKSFRVRVLLTPKDDRLRPDMSANVEIETRVTAEDALRLPMQAVVHKSKKDVMGEAGGEPVASDKGDAQKKSRADLSDWIFVLEGDKVVARQVTLGVSDGEFVEAKTGVTDKDWVVLGPYRVLDTLKNGDSIRATRKDPPKKDESVASAASLTSGAAPAAQDKSRPQ